MHPVLHKTSAKTDDLEDLKNDMTYLHGRKLV